MGSVVFDFSNYYNEDEVNDLIVNSLPVVGFDTPTGATDNLGQLWIDATNKKIYSYLYDGHSLNYWQDITPSNHLVFSNIDVTTEMFAEDTTYEDYTYKATIPLTGVLANMLPSIVFDMAEALSGNYAPIVESYNGGVYLYSKVNNEITIPTIEFINCYVTGGDV